MIIILVQRLAKSCFDVKIGSVLEIFLGSASLKRSSPDATTPVEFPNSIKLLSNQCFSKTKYAK